MNELVIFAASLIVGLWWLWIRLAIKFYRWLNRDKDYADKLMADAAYAYGYRVALQQLENRMLNNGAGNVHQLVEQLWEYADSKPYGGKNDISTT